MSDCHPTIDFSIFTSALRQSMKRVGGVQVVLLLLLGTAVFFSQRGLNLVYFPFFGPVFIHL